MRTRCWVCVDDIRYNDCIIIKYKKLTENIFDISLSLGYISNLLETFRKIAISWLFLKQDTFFKMFSVNLSTKDDKYIQLKGKVLKVKASGCLWFGVWWIWNIFSVEFAWVLDHGNQNSNSRLSIFFWLKNAPWYSNLLCEVWWFYLQ